MAVSTLSKPIVTKHRVYDSLTNLDINTYAKNALGTLITDISTYETGLHNIGSGGGPRFSVILEKFSDTYWTAIMHTYNENTDPTKYFIAFSNWRVDVTAIGY